jgi:hypothetical protein
VPATVPLAHLEEGVESEETVLATAEERDLVPVAEFLEDAAHGLPWSSCPPKAFFEVGERLVEEFGSRQFVTVGPVTKPVEFGPDRVPPLARSSASSPATRFDLPAT